MEGINPEVSLTEKKFSKIIDNIRGAEGPVFDRDLVFYMVAPEVEKDGKPAGEIWKIDLNTGKGTLLCSPTIDEFGGIPAGCQCDRDNNIWVADMRLGLLQVTPEGGFTQVCKIDSSGNPMQGCNDCAFDYDGNLWITAPAGNIAPDPYTRSSQEPFGSIYCYTKERKMVKLDTGFLFSNGIAVQHMPDGRPYKVIVAETKTKILWSYDIKGPGCVENKQKWGQLPGDHEGGPDGMDFDEHDNLLVANHGAGTIDVFSSSGGEPHQRIKCPFQTPSNLHFLPGQKTVYVTEHDNHALWKFEWDFPGKLQYSDLLIF